MRFSVPNDVNPDRVVMSLPSRFGPPEQFQVEKSFELVHDSDNPRSKPRILAYPYVAAGRGEGQLSRFAQFVKFCKSWVVRGDWKLRIAIPMWKE